MGASSEGNQQGTSLSNLALIVVCAAPDSTMSKDQTCRTRSCTNYVEFVHRINSVEIKYDPTEIRVLNFGKPTMLLGKVITDLWVRHELTIVSLEGK